MGVWEQNPARARLKIDGGGSSTAFASTSGARWVLQAGVFAWANLLNSCTITLYEFNATNSSAFFTFMTSATSGFYSYYLGDHGIQASSSYSSRMVFNTGAITGTVCGMFSGYYTGV
jgi:hypothetical protein